jgi:ATP-binding cassette subfamily F protein 3
MILNVNNLYKDYSGECIFKDVSFSVDEKDKIGLIGVNGAGKTTLVKILLEEEFSSINPETNERGTISKKNNLKIGYLSQHFSLNEEQTVFNELMSVYQDLAEIFEEIQNLNGRLIEEVDCFDEIMEKLAFLNSKYEHENGYSVEYKVKQILNGLSISEKIWNEKIKNLSGGQQSRVALGKILLEEPELLILDEPTNHLDLIAIEWLEKFLKEYKKAFILISHDRYFLDNVVNRVFEIEAQTIKSYPGNFTDYTIQKEAYLSGAVKSFEKEQDKIKKMEEFIRRYKAGQKSKQARGRQKLLDRLEKMENPIITRKNIRLKFEIDKPSNDLVLKLKNLKKYFDNTELFSNLNLDIYKGERIGIIGKNGTGKSTLLKMIVGKESISSGTIEIGERVKIGYYDQNHQGLNPENTVLEELFYNFPITNEEARSMAGGFLFTEDDVNKKIKTLSGGEKARVAFMKLMLEKPNFLILDEPTNHLDIYSREILEESLEEYEGTILLVSHDRYFIEGIVDSIYEVDTNGAKLFKGDYENYKSQKNIKLKDDKASLNYEEKKKIKNKISSLEKKLERLEKDLEKYEESKIILEKRYEEAGLKNEVENLMRLQEEINQADERIMEIMQEWEETEEDLKKLKSAS